MHWSGLMVPSAHFFWLLSLTPAVLCANPACPCIEVRHEPSGTSCDANSTIPPQHGSSQCAPWDDGLAPHCHESGSNQQSWCSLAWCYVDLDKCRASPVAFTASGIVPGLYYSYSTCNASAQAYRQFLTTSNVAGKVLRVAIPSMDYPMHFKRDATGAVVTGVGPLYRDDAVRWEGAMIEYMDALVGVSSLAGFEYTWASDGARAAHPESKWTAAVFDVMNGLVDLGGSDFWVTTQRARMAPFTAAFDVDRLYLWVKRPHVDDSLATQMKKVFAPFDWTLWLTIGGVLLGMSLFELWLFREDPSTLNLHHGSHT